MTCPLQNRCTKTTSAPRHIGPYVLARGGIKLIFISLDGGRLRAGWKAHGPAVLSSRALHMRSDNCVSRKQPHGQRHYCSFLQVHKVRWHPNAIRNVAKGIAQRPHGGRQRLVVKHTHECSNGLMRTGNSNPREDSPKTQAASDRCSAVHALDAAHSHGSQSTSAAGKGRLAPVAAQGSRLSERAGHGPSKSPHSLPLQSAQSNNVSWWRREQTDRVRSSDVSTEAKSEVHTYTCNLEILPSIQVCADQSIKQFVGNLTPLGSTHSQVAG